MVDYVGRFGCLVGVVALLVLLYHYLYYFPKPFYEYEVTYWGRFQHGLTPDFSIPEYFWMSHMYEKYFNKNYKVKYESIDEYFDQVFAEIMATYTTALYDENLEGDQNTVAKD
ncbi:unnamed protein product [Plutella xylostella]|uniref:(diamondback moth) hypothetical protein n=1 Tax=Plutella xylostella TaxID=51655 RepID=A0A8S4G847_PLUXY|nr:unnamed protein product [Plutella xylostella]